MVLLLSSLALADFHILPNHIRRAAKREIQHASANGLVSLPINQDEATQLTIIRVSIERHWFCEGNIANADFVQLQCVRCLMGQRVDVYFVLQGRDRSVDGLVIQFDSILAAGK